MAKKELTLSEFREIIKEEALKLKKKIVLENEKKALENELNSLISESYTEDCDIEEGLGKILGIGKEGRMEKLRKQFEDFSKRIKRPFDQSAFDAILKQAEPDNYQGAIQFSGTRQNPSIVYKPSAEISWSGGIGGPEHFGGK